MIGGTGENGVTGRNGHAGAAGRVLAGMVAILAFATESAAQAAPPQTEPTAATLVARAIDLMGGQTLRDVERVRLDMMTQWQRTGYRDVPWTDRPSFEPHVDVRDYTIPAWRNTRDFGVRTITNVVRDSVATTDLGEGPQPLSVAYVDERDELFTYTPDRLLLLLDEASDLASAADTVIGGEQHVLVRATGPIVGPLSVAFHAGTGLPTVLTFQSAHPNDFGLVPFGTMRVDVWYSNWRTFGDISIPTQWDVLRAGAPYKRMTVWSASFDPEFAADSFAVSPHLRTAYLESRGPMHDRAIDSITAIEPGLTQVSGFGFPAGAVEIGGDWVLVEAGHAPLNLDRARRALAAHGVRSFGAALVAAARPGNGGISSLVADGLPVYTSAAAEPFLLANLLGAGVAFEGVTTVRDPTWVELDGGRLRLEPIDLPDLPGSVVAYSPRHQWLYAPDAVTPLDLRIVLDHAETRGWTVTYLGSARGLVAPG